MIILALTSLNCSNSDGSLLSSREHNTEVLGYDLPNDCYSRSPIAPNLCHWHTMLEKLTSCSPTNLLGVRRRCILTSHSAAMTNKNGRSIAPRMSLSLHCLHRREPIFLSQDSGVPKPFAVTCRRVCDLAFCPFKAYDLDLQPTTQPARFHFFL